MKKKRQLPEDPPPEGAPEWMVTYSDLVTLLLCFFVLLYSMATISTEKFEQINRSLRLTFQTSANADRFEDNIGKDITAILRNQEEEKKQFDYEQPIEDSQEEKEELDELVKELRELILELDLGEYVQVLDGIDSVILRINSIILFDLGDANIKNTALVTLSRVGSLLSSLSTDIIVQGHTDDLPINTLLFPSNWELSTKRATNIVKFFIETNDLNPSMLTATGNAEFQPIVPNNTPENRTKNRRIDVVISK
jgi:chemotaxis protein MotB